MALPIFPINHHFVQSSSSHYKSSHQTPDQTEAQPPADGCSPTTYHMFVGGSIGHMSRQYKKHTHHSSKCASSVELLQRRSQTIIVVGLEMDTQVQWVTRFACRFSVLAQGVSPFQFCVPRHVIFKSWHWSPIQSAKLSLHRGSPVQ